jgi:DNA-binding transcriptional LysR family regulator
MSLSLRQLEVVRAVSRHGSVTEAAGALGISQPAVSMVLRGCTKAAGFPLFLRRQGRLQPTEETRLILGELARVFDGIERINRLVEGMRDTSIGLVQIAATPTLADNLLPPAIALVQRFRPRLQIAVQTKDNLSVIEAVTAEQVDFGLVLTPIAQPHTKLIELCSAELVCVVHPEHPLAGRFVVGPADLAPYPLISFSRSLPLGALVDASFRAAGIPRRIAIEVNQSSVACALARAGAGVAIIDPFWLLENRDHGLVRLAFEPAAEVHAQALVPRASPLSRPARLVVAALRRTAARSSPALVSRSRREPSGS